MPALKKGDITLKEIVDLSYSVYGKQVDNKISRQIDISTAKISRRERLRYNAKTRQWEQVGSSVKFIFIVITDPTSYTRAKWDTFNHSYPLFLLIKNIELGILSPIRWRDGSFKKPKFGKKPPFNASATQKKKIRKENAELQMANIKNGIQMQAFFDTHWVQAKYGLLFGPNYANGNPNIRNPKQYPFFSKHMWFVVKNIIIPFFRKETTVSIGKTFKSTP